MWNHFPALVVALPLLCAPLCLVLRRPKYLYILSLIVGSSTLLAATWLLLHAADGGVLGYSFGGWPLPFGIAYRVDLLSALVAFLLNLIFLFVFLYIPKSFAAELGERPWYPLYAALFIAQSGFVGVVLSDDLFNIYVFLEMAALASYGLTAARGQAHDLLAAYQYLLLGTLGAVFFLLGIGFLYALSGTLNLGDLSVRIADSLNTRAGLAALAFISVGLFFKSALFPLHLWLPRVYTYTPSAISALFSGVSSKVALYLLVRFYFDTFSGSAFTELLGELFLILGSVSVIFGSLVACRQHHIKRMMAYSSIAQLGYIVIAMGLLSQPALAAALIHLFNHAIIKCMLFLALGGVVYRLGNCTLAELRGLSRHMPWTAAALVVGGLALVGVPLTSGFISKWYLISAALQTNAWLAVVVLLGSLLSLVYVWRVIEVAYFEKSERAEGVAIVEAPRTMNWVVYALIAIIIYSGVQPGWLTDIALLIANTLHAA